MKIAQNYRLHCCLILGSAGGFVHMKEWSWYSCCCVQVVSTNCHLQNNLFSFQISNIKTGFISKSDPILVNELDWSTMSYTIKGVKDNYHSYQTGPYPLCTVFKDGDNVDQLIYRSENGKFQLQIKHEGFIIKVLMNKSINISQATQNFANWEII